MSIKNTNTIFILLLLAIFLSSCGVKKSLISKSHQSELSIEAKRKINVINLKLKTYKNQKIIESQIILDSIIIIDKIPFLFIKKETSASSEKIGFPLYDFKKLKIKIKENSYLVAVKTKHKDTKTHIGFYADDYKQYLYEYDFILSNSKISKTDLKKFKQEFKHLIKFLK